MKMEPQKPQQHVLFLATENVILHVNQPFKIRHEMIETKNFIPEAFLIHQFNDSGDSAVLNVLPGINALTKSNRDMLSTLNPFGLTLSDPFRKDVAYFSDEDDDEDEDWDEEDEEWDDEDEEWDEEDEDWDEEDEDWDEDDDDTDEEDWTDDEEE